MKAFLNHSALSVSLFSLFALMASAQAADVVGGGGLAGTSSSPLVGSIVFNKDDLTKGLTVSVNSGQDITPVKQKTLGVSLLVPKTGSIAWCDPVANPSITNNTDSNLCYGAVNESKWFVLDFNDMQKKGVKTVYLRMAAKTFSDGDNNPADDDLVPALSVFQGRQDLGGILDWYPNQFQTSPAFWAWQLSPFTGTATGNSSGFATAHGAVSPDKAIVTGKLTLKPGGQNFLTVAVGGDARDANPHDANFQLAVKVGKKAIPASCPPQSGAFDLCGCEAGKQWHAAMNHCMSDASCNSPAYLGQCKTAQMCQDDCGR